MNVNSHVMSTFYAQHAKDRKLVHIVHLTFKTWMNLISSLIRQLYHFNHALPHPLTTQEEKQVGKRGSPAREQGGNGLFLYESRRRERRQEPTDWNGR